MNQERDANGRFKKPNSTAGNLQALNTPMKGTISEAAFFREQLNRPKGLTRRDVLLLLAFGGAATVTGITVLAEPVRDIIEGRITTKYGKFWPFYDDEPFSIDLLPQDLDYFFINKPMRAEEYRISAADLLASTNFPQGLLEYSAEKGVQIVYADAPGFGDERLRNALYAHKMLVWVDAKSSTQMGLGRPVKSVFFAESERKGIEGFLARGLGNGNFVGLAEEVILSHYKDEVIEAISNSSGSVDNLLTVRAIILPPDFRVEDLRNPQRHSLIKIDDGIKDPKLINALKQRLRFR